MDRQERHIHLFRRNFAGSSPKIVAHLRKRIEEDANYQNFKVMHKFSVCLPALFLFPETFKQQYIICICDLDMKHDLKTAKVINWCSGVKNLYPLSTTGDGNCLLHAVSLALWGIEDSYQLLRRSLYVYLSNGVSHNIQRRWKYTQDELIKQRPQEFNYDVTSMELTVEWDNVVTAASDIVEFAGAPFPTLESAHLYGLANLLKRPIIVLAERTARSVIGNSVQENNLYGIYLPLEVSRTDIYKTPIILGYSMNHFAPLVMQANSPDGEGSSQSILPLVMSDFNPLPVRFLLRDEERQAGNLMKKYMYVKNIPSVSSNSITSIPGVVLEHLSIQDDSDIVSAHRRECEQIYLSSGLINMQTATGGIVGNASGRVPSPTHRNDSQYCIQPGCNMYGSPNMANMCTACFNKYTIEYGRREAEQRGQHFVNEPSAPPMTFNRQESYTDLSVMGEKCKTETCQNRCSVKTYPYCHECNLHTSTQGMRSSRQPDLSLMSEKCKNPRCDRCCSVNTHPFCHECKDMGVSATSIHSEPLPVLMTSNQATAGAAESKPISKYPTSQMFTQQCQNKIQCKNLCSRETFPFCSECSKYKNNLTGPTQPGQAELVQQAIVASAVAPSLESTAVAPVTSPGRPGHAEGIDENSLFGEGSIAHQNRQFSKLVVNPKVESRSPVTVQQDENMLEDESLPSNFSFSSGPSSQTHVVKQYNRNMSKSSSVGTPSPGVTHPPHSFPQQSNQQPGSEPPGNATIAPEVTQNRQSTGPAERLKQLCSKPGCNGARILNNYGYCLDCWQGCVKGDVPAGAVRPMDSTEESAMVLGTSEIRRMNPVVTSSKDKKDCASPLCDKKVYPPNNLCEECIHILRIGQILKEGSSSLEERKSPTQEKKARSYSPSKMKCKRKDCTFYGTSKNEGYCSKCIEEVKTAAAMAAFKPAPTLSHIPQYNVPAASPQVPSQPRLCVEPGCDRYGDPKMLHRCTQHFEQATRPREFQPLPPPSDRYQTQGEIMQYNIGEQQLGFNIPPPSRPVGQRDIMQYNIGEQQPVGIGRSHQNILANPETSQNWQQPVNMQPAGQNKEFQSAMTNVENKMRTRFPCKRVNCPNFGSSSRGGYCSECYKRDLQRRGTEDHRPDDPGMNYGCC